jgi:hypothetical protein
MVTGYDYVTSLSLAAHPERETHRKTEVSESKDSESDC